jgi:hypothetical protein
MIRRNNNIPKHERLAAGHVNGYLVANQAMFALEGDGGL